MASDRGGLLFAAGWSLLLALLLLGPALGPGYVLAYDMVWVPDLALRPDFLGTGTALPRAVPSDAVVAVLDEVVPGALLQKLVLLGSLVSVGTGCARLVLPLGRTAMVPAATLAIWNPYVVERLWLGHWTMLLAVGVLPWVLLLARRAGAEARIPRGLPVLVLLGSLSAGAGLMTAVAVLAAGLRRGRASLGLVGLLAAANAPWVVAGLLHRASATSSAAAAEAFAARAEGSLPLPLTVLGLGGVWNREVVPASRESLLGLVALALVAVLAVAGARAWWADPGPAGRRGPLLAALVGWALALVSGWLPGALGWLAAQVPGGGLLRDGSRLLGLCLPLVVVLAARGVAVLLVRVRDPQLRPLLAAVACLGVLATLPDAAWGGLGRLRAVDYPDSWREVRKAVADADGRDVLVLPFTSYRAPGWNGGRKVLDPLGRYLRPDFVASDELYVAGDRLPGEDPRARRLDAALTGETGEDLAAALAAEGVGVVVTDEDAGGEAPALPGATRRFGAVSVQEIPDVRHLEASRSWWVAMAGAWGGWLLVPLALMLRRRRRE
ncbi:hypothetical protein K8W59_10505 [Nocardioides rotundus]|uniref:hypothetical protein n=1 Tax=Nocardioides rotundus TaxID=1774216 RepID=UPI001CBBA9EA|nr:hypothetical protein [Nocardioides rotundus]UAL28326.1 hypothetical protein K8W59_10505 [Nocardioides rotundus]